MLGARRKKDPSGRPVRAWRAIRRWSIGRGRSLALIVLVVAASACGYNTLAGSLAHRWDEAQVRDAASGILAGAEPIDLGPADAGTAVLLVHGFIGASTNFGELPQRLADAGYRVRAMRLPGHGTTPFELRETPESEMLSAVLSELRGLQRRHDRVFIVGHSMGAALSTLAASMNETDGLVLAAPYYRVSHEWYYVLRPETWTDLTAWAVRWLYKSDRFIRINRREAKDDVISYRWVPTKATQAADHLAALARDPVVLKQIACPVLLMHSPEDFAASPRAAERAFERLGSVDKTLLWMENSDHHLLLDYDREEVIAAILKFVERLSTHEEVALLSAGSP